MTCIIKGVTDGLPAFKNSSKLGSLILTYFCSLLILFLINMMVSVKAKLNLCYDLQHKVTLTVASAPVGIIVLFDLGFKNHNQNLSNFKFKVTVWTEWSL